MLSGCVFQRQSLQTLETSSTAEHLSSIIWATCLVSLVLLSVCIKAEPESKSGLFSIIFATRVGCLPDPTWWFKQALPLIFLLFFKISSLAFLKYYQTLPSSVLGALVTSLQQQSAINGPRRDDLSTRRWEWLNLPPRFSSFLPSHQIPRGAVCRSFYLCPVA